MEEKFDCKKVIKDETKENVFIKQEIKVEFKQETQINVDENLSIKHGMLFKLKLLPVNISNEI